MFIVAGLQQQTFQGAPRSQRRWIELQNLAIGVARLVLLVERDLRRRLQC